MLKQKLPILVFLALVASFCVFPSVPSRAQDVRTNHLPGADFGKYKSYRWAAIEVSAHHPNQILDAEIRSSVDSQLATKGLIKTDSDKSDLVVTYETAVEKEKQWDIFGDGAFRCGGGMATAISSVIAPGTIVLDFYDLGAKQLVWQGQATNALNTKGNQVKAQRNIDKAMIKLLKDFPPETDDAGALHRQMTNGFTWPNRTRSG